jgi:hypothetical protein
MRVWSLHPRYLDRQEITACWREALLAQAVLEGGTRGYTRHPQLERFRTEPDPREAIGDAERWAGIAMPYPHPLCTIVDGPIASWERGSAPQG